MPIFKKLKSIVQMVDTETGFNKEFDKPYLLLLVPTDAADSENGEFMAIKGRQAVFETIKDQCISGSYKILGSYVLSGGIVFGNEVTMYTFLRLCIEVYKYGTPDDLDIITSTIYENGEVSGDTDAVYLDQLYQKEIYSSPK